MVCWSMRVHDFDLTRFTLVYPYQHESMLYAIFLYKE